jgi:hypothetical protein
MQSSSRLAITCRAAHALSELCGNVGIDLVSRRGFFFAVYGIAVSEQKNTTGCYYPIQYMPFAHGGLFAVPAHLIA